MSQDENGRTYRDRDKVRRAEHLDGKFVPTTNPAGLWEARIPQGSETLSAADIALGSRGIRIIESCFRRMKTTGLAYGTAGTRQPRWEVRPMGDWMAKHHRRFRVLRSGADDPARCRASYRHDPAADPVPARPQKGDLHTAEGRIITQSPSEKLLSGISLL